MRRRKDRVKNPAAAVGMASRDLPEAMDGGLTEARVTRGRTVRSEGVVAAMAGEMPRRERLVRTERTHPGLHLGFASVALVVATAVAASWPASAGTWRMLPAATVVLLAGVFGAAASTVAAVGLGAWLLSVGFLVNQYGILTWNGTSDMYRLGIIVTAAVAGLAVGAIWRRVRNVRPLVVPPEWSLEWSTVAWENTSTKEEDGHGGRPGVRGVDAGVVRGARPWSVGGGTAVTSTVDGSTPSAISADPTYPPMRSST